MLNKRNPYVSRLRDSNGFTLLEIMIALTIGVFILGGIYSAYITQRKSYISQERVAEMQQNLRATMLPLVNTIRMAGYDPTRSATNAGITVAQPGRIDMLMDLNADGDTSDPGERIQFGFPVATDANNDGIPDAGDLASFGRQVDGAGGYQPIGDNFESFEFSYLDEDGNTTATLADIRLIQISLLTATPRPDRDYTNNIEYDPASGVNANWKRAANTDNFRRRLLITTVVCRNLGL